MSWCSKCNTDKAFCGCSSGSWRESSLLLPKVTLPVIEPLKFSLPKYDPPKPLLFDEPRFRRLDLRPVAPPMNAGPMWRPPAGHLPMW